jgi:hypothetical protein
VTARYRADLKTKSKATMRPQSLSLLLKPATLSWILLAHLLLVPAAAGADAVWWPATDTERFVQSGQWDTTAHRYAAEQALATRQEGAAIEFTFRGRALVLCLDTLTPPNNYGPPELGALEILLDGKPVTTVRPRAAANEVVVLRSDGRRDHRVRVIHRGDSGGIGARIRGFRVIDGPSGELAFVLSGESNHAFVDARAILTRRGQVVRDGLVRNWLTGDCRLAGVPPGDGYALELRAAGWVTARRDGITIRDGEETILNPIYLQRMHDVKQVSFTFPVRGHPVVRLPGGSFRARFAATKAEIREVRLRREYGPAVVSRRCVFEEDPAAGFYYEREGVIAIPADTPPGTYDLEITVFGARGTQVLRSPRSVAVVEAFAADPVFVSWGHLDTWGQYQAEYIEELVRIANLIAPDMVLVSNEANPAYAAGGLHGLEMPFVINFGNHRGPEPGPWFGDPVGAVHFGSAFTVLNFSWPWDRDPAVAENLLSAPDAAGLKILNAYEANAPVGEFLDRHRIALIHYAHGPGPVVGKVGATPTVRVGKSSSSSFRVIRFRDGRPVSYTYRNHATAPIPFQRGGRPPLGIIHESANDGLQSTVSARHYNELEEGFTGARAMFVLPRGAYRATGGRIERAIESDEGKFTVVFVRFDLPAGSSGVIVVQP